VDVHCKQSGVRCHNQRNVPESPKNTFVLMARNLVIFSVSLKRDITSSSCNYMGKFSNFLRILVRKLERKRQKAVSRRYNVHCSGHNGMRRCDILAPLSVKLGARWS